MIQGPPRELTTPDEIRELLGGTRRVAVLGMKTEAQRDQPAFYVSEYLVSAGLEVVPVPVYYPDVKTILGLPVYRRVADVPGAIDLVDVFRRGADIPAHLPDLIAAKPRAVWFQLGIKSAIAASELVAKGIFVVQDRCLMVEHRALSPR